MQAYLDRTSSELYRHSDQLYPFHSDQLYPFQHVFISQVPSTATGYYFPVGAQTCSQWLRTIMNRVGIDPKYKGGSICMAAASAAIDRGVVIDVVLNTVRWASPQPFLQPSSHPSGSPEHWPNFLSLSHLSTLT